MSVSVQEKKRLNEIAEHLVYYSVRNKCTIVRKQYIPPMCSDLCLLSAIKCIHNIVLWLLVAVTCIHMVIQRLQEKKRFNEIAEELTALSTKFSNNVLDGTKSFTKLLTTSEEVDGLPESALALMAQQAKAKGHAEATPESGPWLVTLDIPSYLPVQVLFCTPVSVCVWLIGLVFMCVLVGLYGCCCAVSCLLCRCEPFFVCVPTKHFFSFVLHACSANYRALYTGVSCSCVRC